MRSTEGEFTLVVEASGTEDGLKAAAQAVEPEGTIVLKSTYAGTPAFDFSLGVVVPEVTILGSRCGPFAPALELLSKGRVVTDAMIDATFPLTKWKDAFAAARARGALKILIEMA